MIIDLSEYESDSIEGYDYCIIGTGPAGITLANELKSAGKRVALIESGKLKPSRYADKLRRVSGEGIFIKPNSRERVVGGASTTWSGLSSFLDEVDMSPREKMKFSGWPIERGDLMRFYKRASDSYRFPGFKMFEEDYFDKLKSKGNWDVDWENLKEKIFWAPNKLQNFGVEFRELFEHENVNLYVDATITELVTENEKNRISKGSLRASSGKRVNIYADNFIVATGGIENARILLKSRSHFKNGLGNENDQVGRYMMNHPKGYHGVIKLNEPIKELPHYFGCILNGHAGFAGFRLKEDVQRKEGVLNSYARMVPHFPWSDSRGVEVFVGYLVGMKTLLGVWLRMKKGKVVSLKDYAETGDEDTVQEGEKGLLIFLKNIWLIVRDIHHVMHYLFVRVVQRSTPKISKIKLRNFMEMEPHPDNRVILDEEKDIYEQPIARVLHKTTELDKRSVATLHEYIKKELEEKNIGHLETNLMEEEVWPINTEASHHMGTTRMGNDPKTSVVNPNCRLHFIDNVYLAGSSVFPTSGCANPTFTIVALSIRLAEHLKANVR